MTFPAYVAFSADPRVRRVPWRVYMLLQRERLNFITPVEVKATEVALTARIRPASVTSALNWLTRRGYLIEHGRGTRNERLLTLAWSLPAPPPESVHI